MTVYRKNEGEKPECAMCMMYAQYKTYSGECRKSPPRIPYGTGEFSTSRAIFPYVEGDDWCGEYQPNEDIQKVLDEKSQKVLDEKSQKVLDEKSRKVLDEKSRKVLDEKSRKVLDEKSQGKTPSGNKSSTVAPAAPQPTKAQSVKPPARRVK